MNMREIFVGLEQDEDNYPPFTHEHLQAEFVESSRYRILAAPAFAESMAVGDVVATKNHDGREWVTHVVKNSDHGLFRVVVRDDNLDREHVVKVFNSMGCNAVLTSFGIITIDVPPTVDAEHVLQELNAGFDEGDWDFEVPVRPLGLEPPHDDED